MKKLLTLLLLFPLAYSDEINDIYDNFSVKCKITGQHILETEDGLAKSYSSYMDGMDIGDEFEIEFKFTDYGTDTMYQFLVRAKKKNLILVNNFYYRDSDQSSGLNINYKSPGGLNSSLSENSLMFDDPWKITAMRRYYKNDYEIQVVDKPTFLGPVRNLTASCMNMPNDWDKVISRIRYIDSNNKTLSDRMQ